ncbi:MAG: hypothetical protein K5864_02575 [Bacteroidales bacterium]|nr:hypothetical protein [Bacteroidales bacterium]
MENILDKIKTVDSLEGNLIEKFSLKINPFPKSGIANISDADNIVGELVPTSEEITNEIVRYMQDALSNSGQGVDNKYLSLIIRGDYGMGKTQTLMYIKYLFGQLSNERFNPYVVYIDNPGVKLSELIGNIVSQIGIENFRRYLWDIFCKYLEKEDTDNGRPRKDILLDKVNQLKTTNDPNLFTSLGISVESQNESLSWDQVSISYKYLLDKLLNGLKTNEQKAAVQVFKDYLVKCFAEKYEISSIAEYFYDIVTDNTSVTKSWDKLITGDVKYIEKREVHLLKAIVEITKQYLNATDFVILADEFEEIAIGRLKDADLDNYLRNLRSLIDKEKNWCSVFAMNGDAYRKIEKMSPPLASRIGDRVIDLKPLDKVSCIRMIKNYLSTARVDNGEEISLSPFDESAVQALLNTKEQKLQGSPRFIIQSCYLLLQRAAEELEKGQIIDQAFVVKYLSDKLK